MKSVKYIGAKEHGVKDMCCGTGISWKKGETISVQDADAEKLLQHKTIWALGTKATGSADELPGLEVDGKKPEPGKKEDDEEESFDNPPPQNLEAMTKAAISEYAMREFNLTFGPRDSKPAMIAAISTKLGGKKFE